MGQTRSNISKQEMDEIFKDVTNSKYKSRADFKLIKLLSQKERTKVYLVEMITTKKLYAMKVLDKYTIYDNCAVEQTLQELEIYSEINHPFILKLHYAFQDDVSLYIVTDYCKGGDLAYQMQYHDVFTEKETIFIISCLILALETIHEHDIVNLGLTLEHILLDENGYPKICDFQQAQRLKTKPSVSILHDGLITEFLAPEVLTRENPGIEADFYSLGIIMCYMMSGKKQEESQNISKQELINNILKKNIKNVKQSDLPEGWTDFAGDFINKLTQKRPQNRLGYYGADELKKHKWLQNEPWQKIAEGIIMEGYQPKIKNIETSKFKNFFYKDDSLGLQNEKNYPYSKYALKILPTIEFQELFETYYYSIDQVEADFLEQMQQQLDEDEYNSLKSPRQNNQYTSAPSSDPQQLQPSNQQQSSKNNNNSSKNINANSPLQKNNISNFNMQEQIIHERRQSNDQYLSDGFDSDKRLELIPNKSNTQSQQFNL